MYMRYGLCLLMVQQGAHTVMLLQGECCRLEKQLGETIVEQTQQAVIECEQRISGEQRARESLEQSATQSVEKETARLEKLLDDKLASSGRKFQSAMAKWCKVSGAK